MIVTAKMAAEWVAPRMKGWEDISHTEKVIQWYMNNTLCGIAKEKNEIRGVACIRFVRSPEDGMIPYKHEPEGDWNWVELVVADKGVAISSLFNLLWETYGRRPFVAYRRGLKDGNVRKFTIAMFDRMNRLSERRTELHPSRR